MHHTVIDCSLPSYIYNPGKLLNILDTTKFEDNAALNCFLDGLGNDPLWLDGNLTCADVDVPTVAGEHYSSDTFDSYGKLYLTASQKQLVCCAVGFYTDDGQTCKLCNNGFDCSRPCTSTETLAVELDWWRGNLNESTVHECWNSKSCKGGRAHVSPTVTASGVAAGDQYCQNGYSGPCE